MCAILVIVVRESFAGESSDIESAVRRVVDELDSQNRRRSSLAGIISAMPPPVLATLRESLAGATVDVISRRLKVSQRTVSRNRSRACIALGVRSIPEAAAILADAGVRLPPDSTIGVRPDLRAA